MKFGNSNAGVKATIAVLAGSLLSSNAFLNPYNTLQHSPRKQHGLSVSQVAIPDAPSLTNRGRLDLLSKPPQDNQKDQNNDIPDLGTIMKMLPKKSFDIDTKESLFYFGVDFIACVASLGFLNAVVTSDLYHSFPLWAQALSVAPLQVLSGFALWCMVRFWCNVFWKNGVCEN